jgi:23S rRNA (adenine2503-C2)-methyltransferase
MNATNLIPLKRKAPERDCDQCRGHGYVSASGGGTVGCQCTYDPDELAQWRARTPDDHWDSVRVLESGDENVRKYVFEKGDAVAEAVLYKYPTYEARTVVCCSTQSGCPMGCRFCGAGDNFVRSLTAEEIAEQPERCLSDAGVDPRKMKRLQIMFMSMGEPFLNLHNVVRAIRGLHLKYPRADLLVSTSGPNTDASLFTEVSREIPKVGLQFSVHETTDEARDKLIPFEKKLSLWQIAKRGEYWMEDVGRQPFLNYCVRPGNDTDEDADRLAALFRPDVWQATISVICERRENVAAANERQRALAMGFAGKLLERGFSTRLFDPAGQDDVGGGCGQLWHVQEWMRRNPDKTRPSVGHGKDVVHAPGKQQGEGR